MLTKKEVYAQVNFIHTRINKLIEAWIFKDRPEYDMEYVLAYNEHVENHQLMIPTLGNLVTHEIDSAPVSDAVKHVYNDLCWNKEGDFEYPASEKVWEIISFTQKIMERL